MAYKSDAEIQRDVLQEIHWDRRVHETDVGVSVHHGIVTLTGSVDTADKRHAAQEASHRVPGVLDVANDIIVHDPLADALDDTQLAQAVREALKQSPLVDDARVLSTVTEGGVLLEGTVDTPEQFVNAGAVVRDIKGVKDVRNIIAIRHSGIDHERVHTAIAQALRHDTELDIATIRVSILDNTVILDGKLHSEAEMRAAVDAARAVPGVFTVVNHLMVLPLK